MVRSQVHPVTFTDADPGAAKFPFGLAPCLTITALAPLKEARA